MDIIKIDIWNANGLQQRLNELKIFLHSNKIDVMLISETHLTTKNYIKIPFYKVYDAKHPSSKAHSGTAVKIRQDIQQFLHSSIAEVQTQITAVSIKASHCNIKLAAVYSLPKHKITVQQYVNIFKSLRNKFIAGGHYNAKHYLWGSKTISQLKDYVGNTQTISFQLLKLGSS